MAAIREAAEGQALEARHVTASSMAGNLDDFIVRHNHLFSRMCDSNVVGAGEGGAGAAAVLHLVQQHDFAAAGGLGASYRGWFNSAIKPTGPCF